MATLFGKWLLGFSLILNVTTSAQAYTPEDGWKDAQIELRSEKSPAAQQRLEWWRAARFGMFIHWDMSSVAACEISWAKEYYDGTGEQTLPNPRPSAGSPAKPEVTRWVHWMPPSMPGSVYDNLYKSFYPGMFDADKIVAQAKQAGMKYIVQVAKHHGGFCLWNSQFTDYDMMATPFRRDIIAEMAQACARAGMKYGIYYSQRDWHHPDYGPERMARYNEYMRNQLRELLTAHTNISIVWFDSGGYPAELWEADKLFKMLYELRPDLLINNRCGVPGDFNTPEQKIGTFNSMRDWESCMTFTGYWSWHGFQTQVKPYEECLSYLLSCAGGDGNLLMNIGPMPTGQIDPREGERLKRIGQWLEKNGEAIYSTRGGPYKPGKWGASTHRGNYLYLLITDWNQFTGKLSALPVKIFKAQCLNGDSVPFTQDSEGITVSVGPTQRASDATVIKLELAGAAETIAPITVD